MLFIHCHTCDEIMPAPPEFKTSSGTRSFTDFWADHGHFPGLVTYLCEAGHQVTTGSKSGDSPSVGANKRMKFVLEHSKCEGKHQ